MSSHTPGPWRDNPDFAEIQADNGLGLPVLAKIERGSDPDRPARDQATANGYLMATPPDLLDALEAILEGEPAEGPLIIRLDAFAHQYIRRVVRAARGEQE